MDLTIVGPRCEFYTADTTSTSGLGRTVRGLRGRPRNRTPTTTPPAAPARRRCGPIGPTAGLRVSDPQADTNGFVLNFALHNPVGHTVVMDGGC